MSKPSSSQAFLYLLLTILGLYILASLFSFSFSISDWNAFSNIVFWGASIVLTVWTFNDYVINSDNKNPNQSFTEKNHKENISDDKKLMDFKKNDYSNTTTTAAEKKIETNEYENESSETKKKIKETERKIDSREDERENFKKKATQNIGFNKLEEDYKVEIDSFTLNISLIEIAKQNVNIFIAHNKNKVTNHESSLKRSHTKILKKQAIWLLITFVFKALNISALKSY